MAWVTSAADPRTVVVLKAGGEPRPLTLDRTGTAVWLAVEQAGTFDDLVEAVSAAIAESPAVISSGIRSFVDELLARRLIEPGVTSGG